MAGVHPRLPPKSHMRIYNHLEREPMPRAEIALFLPGLFFGRAIDHDILALRRSERTLYGARVGIRGNWDFTALDFVIAVCEHRW